MPQVELTKEELAVVLMHRKEKLQKQLKDLQNDIDEILSDNTEGSSSGRNNGQSQKGVHNWKSLIDNVLKDNNNKPMAVRHIIEKIFSKGDVKVDKRVATKSIGSLMSIHSKGEKSRYLFEKGKADEKVMKLYYMNPDFKEEK
ncbi:MAG: hypothetical protein JST58_05765 [Bacteroidetes bacterium]|nr:hypothetical protein [Bacteroidota bacterium]